MARGMPTEGISLAMTQVERAIMAPTDRSKPPSVIANVIPQPLMAVSEALTNMLRILCEEQIVGASAAKRANTTAHSTNIKYFPVMNRLTERAFILCFILHFHLPAQRLLA